MGILDGIKEAFGIEQKQLLSEEPPSPQGGLLVTHMHDSILKAVQPKYLYKPPFGYPRPVNTNALRELAKNPYVFSVIKTLADEAASTDWDIVEKETNEDMGITPNDEVRKKMIEFLKNPNINHESFAQLLRQAVVDILEVDAGVWIKVFNMKGELVQLYARDGASFLKNTDIYGTLTGKAPFVEPLPSIFIQGNNDYFSTGGQSVPSEHLQQKYSIQYAQKAAYYQYGQAFAAWPIPFGTREIIYMTANPRADSIYGRSPIEVLTDIVLTLIYGSKYNLDFYLNNNMPEAIVALEGAKQTDCVAFSDRLAQTVRDVTDSFGFKRRMGYRMAITGFTPKIERFQLSPGEMQIIEQQKWFDRVMLRCFGMNENEMGTTDDSNKAISKTQGEVFIRKALNPILSLIKYHMDTQIISEFENSEGWEFKFDDYNLDEDIKRHTLFELQINTGIKTPEMIAEEEGIDVEKLTAQKDENRLKEQAMFGDDFGDDDQSFGNDDSPTPKKEKEKPKKEAVNKVEKKAKNPEMDEITEYIRDVGELISKELSQLDDTEIVSQGNLDKVKMNEA